MYVMEISLRSLLAHVLVCVSWLWVHVRPDSSSSSSVLLRLVVAITLFSLLRILVLSAVVVLLALATAHEEPDQEASEGQAELRGMWEVMRRKIMIWLLQEAKFTYSRTTPLMMRMIINGSSPPPPVGDGGWSETVADSGVVEFGVVVPSVVEFGVFGATRASLLSSGYLSVS